MKTSHFLMIATLSLSALAAHAETLAACKLAVNGAADPGYFERAGFKPV